MVHSLAHERNAFMALYQQYRYAFPERTSQVEAKAASAVRRLRFAHYPLDTRLGPFRFDLRPSIDRAVMAELSTCASSRSAATPWS